jgi:lipoprotein-releasing system ATP-binding protein
MILECTNIQKSYNTAHKALHVLRGIELRIEEGEVLCIVGPSGAGKSTLLHILGGLDRPDKGTVFFSGEDFYSLGDQARAKIRNGSIGFVFQFYHLLSEFTALENVILPALIKENRKDAKRFGENGTAILRQVGLGERVEHTPQELSGGEQQRVAIARALVNKPKILFCDEPTGNLDSKSGEDIIKLLMHLNKKDNQTIVIVTHDEKIAKHANRIIHMKDGKFV